MYNTDFTDKQFKELSSLVYRICGINLNDSKRNLLKARLAKRLRATRIIDVATYIKRIYDDPVEFNNFIDGVTTNHTYFYRENKHCEYLIKHLPNETNYKIWSAASSSGEEPYTIAMQFLQSGFRFDIFASDISDTMLATAKRGVYHIDRVRAVPIPMLHRYFLKGRNQQENFVKVKDEVKRYVTFGKYNLATETPRDTYDIIFCRNVMIYFDIPTKQKVIDDMYRAVKPGGYFIFGQSESVVGIKTGFKAVSPSIYRK